ncbi:hypothetical protein ACC691_37340, partial [Rhizobium johnstonii]|uniref:hypothetical protein n=1 Tax=Rhizobium johnstonii TaxID=3019933 RepID=UPI003F9BE334
PAYALYTSKAHGQGIGDTTQNTTTPVEYRAAPSVTVSKTSDLNPAGDTVVVAMDAAGTAQSTLPLERAELAAPALGFQASAYRPKPT